MKMVRKLGMAGLVLAWLVTACGGGDGAPEAAITDPVQRCGGIGVQPYVANGTACVPSSATPVMLLLVLDRHGDVGACSGVKVAPGRVLTAAHCVDTEARAVAGIIWDGQGQATQVRASGWVTHPSFSEGGEYYVDDVAVVSFADELPVPSAPVLGRQSPRTGQAILIAGWGAPDYALAVGSALLDKVTPDYLRIAYDGSLSNACPGDSGGPALRSVGGRQAVVGLVSTGTNDCNTGGQTFFANLSKPAVLDFILQQAPGVEVL